jgi:hypothetical protein
MSFMVLWRRRPAGDFSDLHVLQKRRRGAGATKTFVRRKCDVFRLAGRI